MDKRNVKLTSAEMGTLWTVYIQNTAMNCFYKHFLQGLEDPDIKSVVKEGISISDTVIKKITKVFSSEQFPLPRGFTDEDVDLTAPPLYTDLFALSFVYRGGQMIMAFYSDALSKAGRKDVVDFFTECLAETVHLYKKSLSLMLEKGVYDRPPKMDYPKVAGYVKSEPSLLSDWFGEGRPLNALELSELFFAIERNGIGLVLLMGLIQTSKDPEIKKYFLKGKTLSQKQIDEYNKFLRKNDGFEIHPVTMEVKNSTIPPFSDKLMLFFITASNQVAIPAMAIALSMSMRKDLTVQYGKLLAEIMKYGDEGRDLLIKRGWMEQPPLSADRNKLSQI